MLKPTTHRVRATSELWSSLVAVLTSPVEGYQLPSSSFAPEGVRYQGRLQLHPSPDYMRTRANIVHTSTYKTNVAGDEWLLVEDKHLI